MAAIAARAGIENSGMSRRIEVIAEVANAHQGDPAQAERLALASLEAGADAVKFQIYFAEELLTRAHARFAHFQKQSFSPETWSRLLTTVQRSGRVYCDVFGLKALEVASAAGVAGYKVHSSDLGNTPLLEAIAHQRKPVLVAVGGSTVQEISRAVTTLARGGVRPVLLHGFQAYPTAVQDTRLERLGWLREMFADTCSIGYSDHVDGADPFAKVLPLVAIGMGASVIEKHVTLDRAARGVDYYSSLEPQALREFIGWVRQAETAVGSNPEEFAPSERTYRRQVKKHWVAARPIRNGETLRAEDLIMKRAEGEAEVPEIEQLLGRPVVRDLAEDTVVSRADVANQVWALVVARMKSCRLPNKALVDVAGMPALAHLLERLKQSERVNRIVLCTTTEPEDAAIEALGAKSGVPVFRGANDDVLRRMIGAMAGANVDLALRVTGDDILADPEYVDRAIDHHLRMNMQYTDMKALPSGTEVEVFDAALLRTLGEAAKDSSGTEYLTTYVVRHRDQLRTSSGPVDERHRHNWRLTLDTDEDLEVIRALLEAMRSQGKALTYRLEDIVAYFESHPAVLDRNATVRQRQTPPNVCSDLDWKRMATLAGAGR